MGVSELRWLKQLEEENRRLKGLVADLTLDKHFAGGAAKKALKPARRRQLTHQIIEWFEVSRQRACGLMLRLGRSGIISSRRKEHVALKNAIERSGHRASALWLRSTYSKRCSNRAAGEGSRSTVASAVRLGDA